MLIKSKTSKQGVDQPSLIAHGNTMTSKTNPTNQEATDIAFEISKILDCGLDKETLSVCIGLLETGINPEARLVD